MDIIDMEILNLIKNKENDSKRKLIIEELSGYSKVIQKLWSEIDTNIESENRIFLIAIRDLIKKKKFKDDLIEIITKEKYSKLKLLLKKEDPKIRKLTCNIIGSLELVKMVAELFDTYDKENQFFVKPTIILAIGMCADETHLDKLKKYSDDLKSISDSSKISKKHIDELNNALNLAIDKISKHEKHQLQILNEKIPVILTTMRNMENVTCSDVSSKYDLKKIDGHVLLETDNLKELFKFRTFYEILHYIRSGIGVQFDENIVVDLFTRDEFITNLKLWHKSTTPFFFRIHYETDRVNKERIKILKTLSSSIQRKSNDFFVNSTTSYEIEFRIIEKNKKCNCYYKLFTFEDNRFDYRKKDIPASVNPVAAAICFGAAKNYLIKDATVLDPFCGSGTMLIERNFAEKTKKLHGIDISQNAINAARTNLKESELNAKLTKFDSTKFSSKIQYDEVVSNMPYGMRVGSHSENKNLYRNFIDKLPELIKLGGRAFLLTTEVKLLTFNVKINKKLKILEEFKIDSGGLLPRFFVIERVK